MFHHRLIYWLLFIRFDYCSFGTCNSGKLENHRCSDRIFGVMTFLVTRSCFNSPIPASHPFKGRSLSKHPTECKSVVESKGGSNISYISNPNNALRQGKINQNYIYKITAFALVILRYPPLTWVESPLFRLAENRSSYPRRHHLCFIGFPCWVRNLWYHAIWKNSLHTHLWIIMNNSFKTKNKLQTQAQHLTANMNKHQRTMSPASESMGPSVNEPSFRRFRGFRKAGAFPMRNDSSNSSGDVSGKFNDSMDVKAKSKPVCRASGWRELGNTSLSIHLCHCRGFKMVI